jgi:hypothetical protein
MYHIYLWKLGPHIFRTPTSPPTWDFLYSVNPIRNQCLGTSKLRLGKGPIVYKQFPNQWYSYYGEEKILVINKQEVLGRTIAYFALIWHGPDWKLMHPTILLFPSSGILGNMNTTFPKHPVSIAYNTGWWKKSRNPVIVLLLHTYPLPQERVYWAVV